MLHIILTILKIIGIIVLVIIGLVLLICACILFVPVRYNARITYKDKLKTDVWVTYLFHAVSAKYRRKDAEGNIELRIFGFKTHFFDREKKEQNKKYEEDTRMFEEMSEQMKGLEEKKEDTHQAVTKEECHSDKKDTIGKEFDEANIQNGDSGKENAMSDEPYGAEEALKKPKGINKIKKIKIKIKEIIHKIKYRFKKICGTIRKVFKNIRDFKAFISDDKTKKALSLIKKESVKLIKHIRPKKIRGYLIFGFDDPSYTGRVLGLIYMFSRGTRKNFQIGPDFENKVFETDVQIKGRIQVYFLLIIAYRFYKDKNFREVIERRRTYGREQ